MESEENKEYSAKDVAFYSAMLNAWLNTKLERDKQLLGLSVTAIGLLVTLLRITGVSGFIQLGLFSFALAAFLITVISVIYILGENANHIEGVLADSETENETLEILDKIAGISFAVGMVIVVIIGLYSAFTNLNGKGINMSQEKSSDSNSQPVQINDSWNNVAKLRPQPPKKEPQPGSTKTSGSGSNSSSNTGQASNDS